MSTRFLKELPVHLDKEILVLFSKVQDADDREERKEERQKGAIQKALPLILGFNTFEQGEGFHNM